MRQSVSRTVGFVGLGVMGSEMGRALLRSAYEVRVFDLDPSAVERLAGDGAVACMALPEVAVGAEAVLLSLPYPSSVRQAVAGPEGLLSGPVDGLVIVDTSTVDPATSEEMGTESASHGVGYLDAPVLGRPDRCGAWTLPVGGDPEVLSRVRPILETLASQVVHVGPLGTGDKVKLLNNLMLGAINAITAECMSAAAKLELDPSMFFSVVAESGAASVSNLFLEIGPKIVAGDDTPVFSLDLLHKDLSLALHMLRDAGIPAIVSTAVEVLTTMGKTGGQGPKDSSALVHIYEEILGIKVSSER